jgi:nucleotide-binding universal stress UspA family protein
MFTHILVALDGSEPADHALTLALRLSEGEKLTALHVVPDYGLPEFAQLTFQRGADLAHDVEALRARLVAEGRRKLDEWLACRGCAGRPVERLVRIDAHPYQAIIDAAGSGHCDLIVMGSRGHGAVASMLLGSQALHVLSLAKVPVLIAR